MLTMYLPLSSGESGSVSRFGWIPRRMVTVSGVAIPGSSGAATLASAIAMKP